MRKEMKERDRADESQHRVAKKLGTLEVVDGTFLGLVCSEQRHHLDKGDNAPFPFVRLGRTFCPVRRFTDAAVCQ